MELRELMTTELVTVTIEDSLQDAVTHMLEHRVGSVLVESGGEPVGILTETDVLAVGTTFERPFSEIPVTRAMSENPITATPDTTLDEAMETLHDHGIKKLPVVEGDDLVGIVTLTDFVYHQHELASEAEELERERNDDIHELDPVE